MAKVRITVKPYEGWVATVLEEGTFETFGRMVTGVKVKGIAAPLILAKGEYEYDDSEIKPKGGDGRWHKA